MIWDNPLNHHLHNNDTIDVSIKGCFVGYDTVACVRRSLLSALMVVTFILCLMKIGRFHSVHHEQAHHYVIFYMAAVEAIICTVNWMLSGHYPELDMAATALKVLQLVTLCHFHWVQAWRILHRETIAKRIWFPLMGLLSTYVIAVASMGIIDAADFIGVQLFLIAGIYITRKINEVSTLECVKKTQKRNLWAIITAFEVSAIVGLSYDLTVTLLGDENVGCSGIFNHMQAIYSPVFFVFMVFKFCLPIWSLLAVLEPLPSGISYSEIIATSHSGSLVGACVSHSVGSPYRVLRSYVFDDNADFLGRYPSSPSWNRRQGRPVPAAINSSDSTSSDVSTRQLFSGRVMPSLYVPGHGHILPPAPRPGPGPHDWSNPRDYWRSRQRLNSTGAPTAGRPDPLSVISEETNQPGTRARDTEASTVDPEVSSNQLLVEIHRPTADETQET